AGVGLQAYALDRLAHLAAFPGVAVAAGGAPVGESAYTVAAQDRAPAGVAAGTDTEHAAGVVAGEATLPALIDPCHHQRAGARLGRHVVIGSSNGDVEAARQTEYSHAGVPLPEQDWTPLLLPHQRATANGAQAASAGGPSDRQTGKKTGTNNRVKIITTTWRGTPTFTKSTNRYWPGPSTRVL